MNPDRLLVIDDEAEICDFIKIVAEDNGFEVAVTGDSDRFTETYDSLNPSVIVLDLNMPRVDGIELLRFLSGRRCDAQILVISGADSKVLNTVQRLGVAEGLNMLAALQKPIMLGELERCLDVAKNESDAFTEEELRTAISRGEFVVYYQPKVQLNGPSGAACMAAAEALARWQHPTRGLIGPDAFMPLAESSDLIVSLTDAVIAAVVRQIAVWNATRPSWHGATSPVSVAVNLSPRLLHDLSLPDNLGAILNEHNVSASQLIVEVTENAVMADVNRAMDILTRLRLKGMSISIDDFGTGYSSLVQLYRMPFSELKIDRSFVRDVIRNDEAKVIVRSIVDLAHNLGITVCAEGVETRNALEFLRSLGCDSVQGFLIGKPVPPEDLSEIDLTTCKAA